MTTFRVAALAAGMTLLVGCTKPARAGATDGGAQPGAGLSTTAAAQRPLHLVPITTAVPDALAAFKHARALADNNREGEAVLHFRKAIELDPTFALAHSYLGFSLPGGEGLAALKKGLELAKSQNLPPAEQEFCALYLSIREGDTREIRRLLDALVHSAPDEWRVTFQFGQLAFEERDWEGAVTAYTHSIDIVQSCVAYNNLGYALGMQDRLDLAASAFRRCAEISPNEPNAHDSLGEVQLAANKLDQAEASFRRAIQLDPEFFSAFHGVAVIDFLRGNWDQGFAEMGRSKNAATLGTDQVELDIITGWAQLTQQKPELAFQVLERAEREARGHKEFGQYHQAWVAVTRSMFLHELGRNAEAIEAAEQALTRARSTDIPGALAHAVRRRAIVRKALAQISLKKLSDAEKTLVVLEDESRLDPENGETRAALHLVRGTLHMATGDASMAKAELFLCNLSGLTAWTYDYRNKPEEPYCAFQNYLLAAKAGDSSLADKLKRAILAKPSRDPMYLYLSRKLAVADVKPKAVGRAGEK